MRLDAVNDAAAAAEGPAILMSWKLGAGRKCIDRNGCSLTF